MPGRIVTSWASWTSASIHVVAGSMTVTPSFIHWVTMRRFSSRPSSASWARSLAPSVCITSSMVCAPTVRPASRAIWTVSVR